MSSTQTTQINNLAEQSPGGGNEFSTIGNDPLAYVLIKLHLLGTTRFRKWIWPCIFTFVYLVVDECLLPLVLHRFSSTPGYIGPFDLRLLPYRIVDAVCVLALVYYYGQTNLLIPTTFDRLLANGIFGSSLDEEVQKKQKRIFLNWVNSIWLTPLAIAIALWIAVISSVDYASPPRPRLFINSGPYVFAFNVGLWFLNYYMVAIIIMRFALFALWLLRLQSRTLQWQQLLKPDVLHSDNRMGFKPITDYVILVAKILVVVFFMILLILRGNENIGLSPTSPSWISYLLVLCLSTPVVLTPIYLVHRFMQREKELFVSRMVTQMGLSHSELLSEWPHLSDSQQTNVFMAQMLLLRLGQIPDWPVTIEEITTIFLTYLLGASLTILSAMQSILDFLTR